MIHVIIDGLAKEQRNTFKRSVFNENCSESERDGYIKSLLFKVLFFHFDNTYHQIMLTGWRVEIFFARYEYRMWSNSGNNAEA
jgi:hypothetical protein